MLAEAHHQLGRALEAQGKPQDAKAAYTEALAQDPGLDEARFSLRSLTSKLDETTSRCKSELKGRPRDSELWYKLGITAVASGRQIDGAQAFQRCLEQNPKHAGALQGYGECLETLGRFKAAAEAFSKAAAARPDDPQRHLATGTALLRLLHDVGSGAGAGKSTSNSGKGLTLEEKESLLKSAIESFERAVQLGPALPQTAAPAYAGLGDALDASQEEIDARRISDAYEASTKLDASVSEVWHKLGLALEGQGRLFDAGVAFRGCANALAGNATSAATAEQNLARVVSSGVRFLMSPSSARSSSSAVSSSTDDEEEAEVAAAAAAESVVESQDSSSWWGDRAGLRAALAGVAAARHASPSDGPTLQLIAALTDRLARVPPSVLAQLVEDPTNEIERGKNANNDDDDGEAAAAMLLPLGLSTSQVQASAVASWRRAVSSESSTPDARIGLANALLVAAAAAGASPSARLPAAARSYDEDEDDDPFNVVPQFGAATAAAATEGDDDDEDSFMVPSVLEGESGAAAMVRESVLQVEAALALVQTRRARAVETAQNNGSSAAQASSAPASGGIGAFFGLGGANKGAAPSSSSAQASSSSSSEGSGDIYEAMSVKEEDRVGAAALRLGAKWFAAAPHCDLGSAARVFSAVLVATSSNSSVHKAALSAMAALAARATEISVCLPDLAKAVAVQAQLFDSANYAAAARKEVQDLVLGLVSTGRSEDAAACTAQLNRGPRVLSSSGDMLALAASSGTAHAAAHARAVTVSFSATSSSSSAGPGMAAPHGKKTRRASQAAKEASRKSSSSSSAAASVTTNNAHGDLIGGSVADQVCTVADARRMESHLVDAKHRYLRALNVQPDHLGSLLGLVALAEALFSGQKDSGPHDGDLVKASKDKKKDGTAAASSSSKKDAAASEVVPPDPLVRALPETLLDAGKQAALEVCGLVLQRIASNAVRQQQASSADGAAEASNKGGGKKRSTRQKRLDSINLRAVELSLEILGSFDAANLFRVAPPPPPPTEEHDEEEEAVEGEIEESKEAASPGSGALTVSSGAFSSKDQSPFNNDSDITTVLALYERLLVSMDEYVIMNVDGSSSASNANAGLDLAYLRATTIMLDVTRSVVDLATGEGSDSTEGLARVHAVKLASGRWANLLALASSGYTKVLRRVSLRWSDVVVPRCIASANGASSSKGVAVESKSGNDFKAPESDPSMPPRGAFALHLAEARAYAGLMDIEDARLAGAMSLISDSHAGAGLESGQSDEALATAAASLAANPTAAAMADAADAAHDALFDRLTIAVPGTAYAGLPVPVALQHLSGSDGPVLGGWWTPCGLAGPGPMTDAAEAHALAKTLNLRAAMGSMDDGAGTLGGAAWGFARAAVAFDALAELQARSLAGVLAGAERRARGAATLTGSHGSGWRAPMASLDGYGYGRVFTRLASRWQHAGDKLRESRRAATAAAGANKSAYQRFLGRLGAVDTEEADDSAGAVAHFGLVLRLQAQASLRLITLASATLKSATTPGTREDEDGVYGAVAVVRYAMHRMPKKQKLQLADPSGSSSSHAGASKGGDDDEDDEEEKAESVVASSSLLAANSKSGKAAKAGVRLRVAQAGWVETVEVLEARALSCIVDASVKLHDGAAASGGQAPVGFGLRDEAQRVLEETVQEFGHRLSPAQSSRLWRALARNKAASDPQGCVTAYTRAKQLSLDNYNNSSGSESSSGVLAAHPSSSASVVAAALAAARAAGSGRSSDARDEAVLAVEAAAALTDGDMDASDWLDGGKLDADDRVALAAATATLGDFSSAAKECAAAVEDDPGRAPLYVHLGGALLRQLDVGAWPLASSTLATGLGVRHVTTTFLRLRLGSSGAAMALAQAKKARAAKAPMLVSAAQAKVNAAAARDGTLSQEEAAAETALWNEITACYDEALGLDPKSMGAAAHYFLGQGRLKLGDPEGALRAFQVSCRLDPLGMDALLQSAMVLDQFAADYAATMADATTQRMAKEEALKAYQRCASAMAQISVQGGTSRGALPVNQHNEATVEVQLRVGQLASSVGDKAAALAAYGQVLVLSSDHTEAKNALADLHGDVAMTLFWSGSASNRHGDYVAAESSLREAVQLQPLWVEARSGLSFALHHLGRHAEGMAALPEPSSTSGVLLGRHRPSTEIAAKAQFENAKLAFKGGDMGEALAFCEQALEDNRLMSQRLEAVQLLVRVSAELVDSNASLERVSRALNAAVTNAAMIESSGNNAAEEGVHYSINTLAMSWIERGLLLYAAAAFEAILVVDHENLRRGKDNAAGTHGPRGKGAKAALIGLETVAENFSAGDASQALYRRRCAEFAALPPAAELEVACDEAKQQMGRGNYDGAVKTYRRLLRLKSNLKHACDGLVLVSQHLRLARRFDQAAEVCAIVRSAAPDHAGGALELAQVHICMGDMHSLHASSSGGDRSQAIASYESAWELALSGAPEVGCIEAAFKLAQARGGEGITAAEAISGVGQLGINKASVHLARAATLLQMDLGNCDASVISETLSPFVRESLRKHAKVELARAVKLQAPSVPPEDLLVLAELCHGLWEFAEAATHLTAAIAVTDANTVTEVGGANLAAHAHLMLGSALEAIGETSRAVEATERAASMSPSMPRLADRLRAVRLAHGAKLTVAPVGESNEATLERLEAAVSVLSVAAASDQLSAYKSSSSAAAKQGPLVGGDQSAASSSLLPYDVSVHQSLAAAHFQLGGAYAASKKDGEKALEQNKLAVEHDGAREDARAALAGACRSLGAKLLKAKDVVAATRCLEDACRAEPANGAGWLALARVQEDQGLIGAASRSYQTASRNGEDSAGHGAMANLSSSVDAKIKELKAEGELAKAASKDPEVFVHLGEALETKGDYKNATKAYESALKIYPDHADALFHLACVLLRRHDIEEAALYSGDAEKLGLAFTNNGGRPVLLAEAVQHFRRSSVFLAESAEVQGATGCACVRLQRCVDALVTAKAKASSQGSVLATSTGANQASSSSSSVYVHQGGQTPLDRELAWREAAEALRSACVLSPGYVAAFVALAEAKTCLGDAKGALALVVHACRVAPNDPTALYHLGSLRMGAKELEPASVALNQALSEASAATEINGPLLMASGLSKVKISEVLASCYTLLGAQAMAECEAAAAKSGTVDEVAAFECVDLFDQAIKVDPTAAGAHFLRGCALQRVLVDLDAAEDAFVSAQASFGDDAYADATAGLASVEFARSGGLNGADAAAAEVAVQGFKQAIREGYRGSMFRVELAEVLASLRRWQDAAVVYRSLLEDGVNEFDGEAGMLAAWAGLASVRILQGRFADAADCFGQILKLRPNDVRARMQRGLCLRSVISNHYQNLFANQEEEEISSAIVAQEGGADSSKTRVARRLDQSMAALQPTSVTESSTGAGGSSVVTSVAFDEKHTWQEVERAVCGALGLGPAMCAAEADLFVPACLALGEAHEFLGRQPQAIAIFELVVRFQQAGAQSNDSEALLRLGKAHFENAQYDASVKFLKEAISAGNTSEDASPLLAQALTMLGKRCFDRGSDGDAALTHLKEALEIDANAPLAWHYQGLVLLEHSKDASGAAGAQRQALKLDPSLGAAHTALATCLEALGDLQAAVASYEAGIDLGSKTADAYAGLGDTLAALGKGTPINGGAPAGKRGSAKAPPPVSAATSRKSKKGLAAADAALASEVVEEEVIEYQPPTLAQMHARTKAAAAYAKALELDAYHGPALYGAALCLASLQDYEKAIATFRRANVLKAHQGDAAFLAAYGISCVRRLELDAQRKAPTPIQTSSAAKKDRANKAKPQPAVVPLTQEERQELWIEASSCLAQCIALKPNSSYEAYIALSTVKLEFERKPDAALALVQRASAIDATKPHAHVSTAKVLATRGQTDEAITAFLTALGLLKASDKNPEEEELEATIKPALAACYVTKGEAVAEASKDQALSSLYSPSEVEKLFEAALSHDPTSVGAQNGLAEALYLRANATDDEAARTGSGADATVRLYASSLKHRPGHGPGYMRMGLALERNGLVPEAIACMERAVKFDPTLVEAYRALGRLSTEPEDIVTALEQACRLVPDDYDLRVQYGATLVKVGRVTEALECGRAACALAPKRFEALVVSGDAADGLEAHPTAAQAYLRAVATVIDTRRKFIVAPDLEALHSAQGVVRGGNEGNTEESMATNVEARKAAAARARAVSQLQIAFARFEKDNSGIMDAADVVLLIDALGLPSSSSAAKALRDQVASKGKAEKRGSMLLGKKRDKSTVQRVRLRDVEEWWLAQGAAAAASQQESGGDTVPVLADLDGSAGTGERMTHAPESLDESGRSAVAKVDLSSLYLKLGVSYYRALLARDEQRMAMEGDNNDQGGNGSNAGTLATASTSSLAARQSKPTNQGGPSFGASRAAPLGSASNLNEDSAFETASIDITWEAAYRAFTKASELRTEYGLDESADVLFYLGEACEKLGDRARALTAFERARIADKTHIDAIARIGAIRGAMGDHDGALDCANECLSIDPLHLDAQAVLLAANGALASKLCDEAERLLNVEEDDDGTSAYEENGEAAVALFRAAVDQDTTYARAYHLMGNVLEYQGKFAEAVEAQRLAVQHGKNPQGGGGYAEAHLALGVALEAQQRTAEAVENYDRAVVLLPQNSPSRIDAQLCLADALTTHGALDRAEAAYSAVASVASGPMETAHASFGLGMVHRKKGVDLPAAVASLRAACGVEPDTARFWCALGGAAEALAKRAASGRVNRREVDEPGLWADASAAFGRAVELQPELWDAVVGLARVRRHQGMKGLAMEKVQAVLASQPRHPDALAFAGVVAAADGKHGEAIRLFTTALTQEPSHAECLYHMGNSLFDVGRAEEAIAAFRKCLGQAEGSSSTSSSSTSEHGAPLPLMASDVAHGASYNLGVVLEQQGDRQGATAAYELASKLAPFDTDPLVNLGSVLLADQKFDQAVRTYTRAATVDPSDPSVHYSLSLALDARNGPGDLEAAKDALDRALKLDPDSTAAHLHAGVMAERSGDYSAATVAYRTILRSSKPGPRFYLRLGGAMVRDTLIQRIGVVYPRSSHDPNAALAPETTAEAFATGEGRSVNAGANSASQQPGSTKVSLRRSGANDETQDAQLTAAAAALGTAANDDGAAAYAASQEQSRSGSASGAGGSGDGLSSLVRSLGLLAGTTVLTSYADGAKESSSQLAGALEVFRSALKLDPRLEARAQLGIGLVLELTNDLDGAVDAYSRAVELNPRDADGFERLGVLLDRLGLLVQAREAHSMAAKLRPENPDVLLRLAASHGKRDGRKLEELASYRRLLDRFPKHAACQFSRMAALISDCSPDMARRSVSGLAISEG